METKVGKFTFTIPEGHPQAGEKLEKPFEYPVCNVKGEAEQVLIDKKWSLEGMVNDALKANARANAYQTALLPYRPSEVPVDDIVERMVRDYIRIGVPEAIARAQVKATLAAMGGSLPVASAEPTE